MVSGLRILSLLILASLIQTAGLRVWAEETELIDAEVEESMLDSDATSEQAQLMRQRQMRLQLENERDRRKAQELREKAAVRQRESRAELTQAEAQVKALLAEQKQLHQEVRKSSESLKKSDTAIKAAREKLAKTKLDNETLASLKEAQNKRLQKNHEVLARLQNEQAQADLQQRRHKEDWEKLKSMSDDSERKISSAQKGLKTRGAKRSPAALGPGTSTSRSPAASRRLLAQDCKVYEQPDEGAKVLGIKRAGSTVAAGPEADSWVAVRLLKRTLYVRSDCF